MHDVLVFATIPFLCIREWALSNEQDLFYIKFEDLEGLYDCALNGCLCFEFWVRTKTQNVYYWYSMQDCYYQLGVWVEASNDW